MSIRLKILVFWAKNEHLRAFDTNFCVRFACMLGGEIRASGGTNASARRILPIILGVAGE